MQEVTQVRPQLTDAERQAVHAIMKRFEPSPTLEFVVTLPAGVVARQLAAS